MATTTTPQRTWYYRPETIAKLAPEMLDLRPLFDEALWRRIATSYIRGLLAEQRRMRALERQDQRSRRHLPVIVPVVDEEEAWPVPF